MIKKLKRNWPAKLMTLIVAVMIWFLINYIVKNENQTFIQPGLSEDVGE